MYSSGFFARNCKRIRQRHSVRDITVERIMRAGLIGQEHRERHPRFTISGKTSAQLPTRPTETARCSFRA